MARYNDGTAMDIQQQLAALREEGRQQDADMRSLLQQMMQTIERRFDVLEGRQKQPDAKAEDEVLNPGSLLHSQGTCRPCAFWRKGICNNGQSCEYCHYKDHPERQKRKKGGKKEEDSQNSPEEERPSSSASSGSPVRAQTPSRASSSGTATPQGTPAASLASTRDSLPEAPQPPASSASSNSSPPLTPAAPPQPQNQAVEMIGRRWFSEDEQVEPEAQIEAQIEAVEIVGRRWSLEDEEIEPEEAAFSLMTRRSSDWRSMDEEAFYAVWEGASAWRKSYENQVQEELNEEEWNGDKWQVQRTKKEKKGGRGKKGKGGKGWGKWSAFDDYFCLEADEPPPPPPMEQKPAPVQAGPHSGRFSPPPPPPPPPMEQNPAPVQAWAPASMQQQPWGWAPSPPAQQFDSAWPGQGQNGCNYEGGGYAAQPLVRGRPPAYLPPREYHLGWAPPQMQQPTWPQLAQQNVGYDEPCFYQG